jgi:hypothetical protein
MGATSRRVEPKAAERQASAVDSASRDIVDGRTVLSVPAHISGFTVSQKKS